VSEFIPNSFQVPNVLIDRLQPHLKPVQFSCLLFIIRKTRGWHKLEESIPITEFSAACFGADRRTIFKALDVLERAGLVDTSKRLGKVNRYSLNPIFSEPVSKNATGQVVTKIVTRLVTLNVTGSGKTSDKNCHSIENNKTKKQVGLAPGRQKPKTNGNQYSQYERVLEVARDLGLKRGQGETRGDFRSRVQLEYSRSKFDAMQS